MSNKSKFVYDKDDTLIIRDKNGNPKKLPKRDSDKDKKKKKGTDEATDYDRR